MGMAELVGWAVGLFAETDKIDGRSTSSVRAVTKVLAMGEDDVLKITITGLSDRNHDGLDDDARLTVRAIDNVSTLTLHKNYTHSVADGGFVFRNRLSVLKESAQSFDRILRWVASIGGDSWDMSSPRALKDEMPAGVRVVSGYDGNHDGYDDDGRLTFLANGKAVTLTIGNTGKEVGKVTYGPTWKTKAPKRTHHPVGARGSNATPPKSSGPISEKSLSGLKPSARVTVEFEHVLHRWASSR
jgi:hypothetical protein